MSRCWPTGRSCCRRAASCGCSGSRAATGNRAIHVPRGARAVRQAAGEAQMRPAAPCCRRPHPRQPAGRPGPSSGAQEGLHQIPGHVQIAQFGAAAGGAPIGLDWRQIGGNARIAQVEDRSHSVRSGRASRSWLFLIAIGEPATTGGGARTSAVASRIWQALCGNCGMPVAAVCARTSVHTGRWHVEPGRWPEPRTCPTLRVMPGDHHTPWILAGEKETLVDFPAGFLVSPFSGCPMRLLSAFQPICASRPPKRRR